MAPQSGTPAAIGTIFRLPDGICGMTPSFSSSSRSFSMAMARKLLSALSATEFGLAAEIAGRLDLLGGEVDDGEVAGRLGLALRRVDAGEHLAAGDGDRGRLAVDLDDAAGLGGLGVGDVDEADRAERAVGIDERHAVFAGGDDLGRGRRGLLDVGRQVVGDREAGDAVEHLSAWAGSETEAASAAVRAKSVDWRGMAASPSRNEAAMLWDGDISGR